MTDDDPVLAAYPEYRDLGRLDDLRASGGWFFTVRHEAAVEPATYITGVRPWPDGSADLFVVRNFTTTSARRTNPAGGVVWLVEGSLGEVVDSLLELPEPSDPRAPTGVIRSSPGLWTSE